MVKSLLIKITAVLMLAVYSLSYVGVNVHKCMCTGHVCVSLAMLSHHDYDHNHDHGHGHCCGSHHCGHHDDDCCHNEIFKIVLSGDSDHADHINMQAPSVDVHHTCYATSASQIAYGCILRPQGPCAPPHYQKDILRSICIIRV